MQPHHLIVYFSPAGSTRLVAETIRHRLADHGCVATVIDLGDRRVPVAATLSHCQHRPCCLWLGTPVYCDHAVPVVSAFVEALPPRFGGYGVPFVTWGGVTSGLALPELAERMLAKECIALGAAKVLAVHSSLWHSPRPLAAGHPDAADLAQIVRLVDAVVGNLAGEEVVPLDVSALDYLSPSLRAEACSKSLALAKASMPPLQVEAARCSQCGECAEICPVAAITLNPWPAIGPACVLCLQCVRTCPQEAFPLNSEAMASRISAMAAHSDEAKTTAIFC